MNNIHFDILATTRLNGIYGKDGKEGTYKLYSYRLATHLPWTGVFQSYAEARMAGLEQYLSQQGIVVMTRECHAQGE